MIWELPCEIEAGGKSWKIRTDYRDILNILVAFEDPDLTSFEKQYVCLFSIYIDFEEMPKEMYPEAYQKAMEFIDCGKESKKKSGPKTMDWEQDAHLIFPAVNHVAGTEVRALPYLHWWTFMGYFMEIKDGIFSNVLSLRQKKSKGEKLEKSEEKFWASNKDICVISPKLTEEEKAERDRLRAMVGV